MAWRSLLITQRSYLHTAQNSLVVKQAEQSVQVPLEDISTVVIDHPQITLSARLLSACAERNIALITVDDSHLPNGMLQSFLPHSRALKVAQAQMAMSKVVKNRFWQTLVRQKISNQASVLLKWGHPQAAQTLKSWSQKVQSADKTRLESQAAQYYFKTLFGQGFTRRSPAWINSALNYGFSIVRSLLARQLVGYGFLPLFGLGHVNQQNAFNLADDLIEPYRPHVEDYVLTLLAQQERVFEEGDALAKAERAYLIQVLHQDIARMAVSGKKAIFQGKSTLLALTEATVISLSQQLLSEGDSWVLPGGVEDE